MGTLGYTSSDYWRGWGVNHQFISPIRINETTFTFDIRPHTRLTCLYQNPSTSQTDRWTITCSHQPTHNCVENLAISFFFHNYVDHSVLLTHMRKSRPFFLGGGGAKANSLDPDQMQQSAVSDQGLHCLLIESPIKI